MSLAATMAVKDDSGPQKLTGGGRSGLHGERRAIDDQFFRARSTGRP